MISAFGFRKHDAGGLDAQASRKIKDGSGARA